MRASEAGAGIDIRQLLDVVVAARSAGMSWSAIGSILGTSAQAAQQRSARAVLPH